jgi:uncharacterized protein (TIGR03435 family)
MLPTLALGWPFLCAGCLAQSIATDRLAPTFDVASVKLVPSSDGARRQSGARISQYPGYIRYHRSFLLQILTRALRVQPDQFVGPSWLSDSDGERYEIDAKFPVGTPPREIDAMMLNLVEERFGLKYHREKREFEVYELVRSEGGPKLQPAEVPSDESPVAGPLQLDKEGYPILPPGHPGVVGASPKGRIFLSPTTLSAQFAPIRRRDHNFGLMRFSFRMVTIAQVVGAIQNLGGISHVVDHTGLEGKFDFKLAFVVDGLNLERDAGDVGDPGPDMFSALQKQLGLKLRKQKTPIDVIVIDAIHRVPVEN